MSQPYISRYLPICKQWEGCVPWFYLDTKANVTVWVGFEVASALAAQALPMYLPGGTVACTEQEKAAAWKTVSAIQPGRLPASYEYSGCPIMLPSDGDALLLAKLDTLDEGLAAGIPNFEELPDGWKMALTDIAWNLGLHGLLNGYPRMLAAIEAGDGATAAAECHRNGIGDERNTWTAAQFSGQAVAEQ